MRRMVLSAASGIICLITATQLQAQPMVATYTGVITDTSDPFTATFFYNTKDLATAPGNSQYLESVGSALQRATYVDPTHNVTFSSAGMFSKGEYTSVVTNDDGSEDTNTVHEYDLQSSSGGLDLTFGGADDFGFVSFGTDGSDFANLTPELFTVGKDVTVAPVPLPATSVLFGTGLALLGLRGRIRRSPAKTI